MTLARRIASTATRAAVSAGGNLATIRRSGPGLKNGSTGQVLTTLAVNGTVAAGGSSLNLDAAAIEAGGVLGQGWKFTLVGHTAPYEVQADVTASSNALASVSISPVLSHEATDDAVATITQKYGEWSYLAFRKSFEVGQVDGESIQAEDYMLVLSTLGASFTDIQSGGDIDRLTFDGKVRSIVRVLPIEPGTEPGALRVHCRG